MTPPLDLGALRRRPDVEAPNLVAVDAADRLILDTAADALEAVRGVPEAVAVVGDAYGALTLGAIDRHGAAAVRVHQDALTGELALAANAGEAGIDGFRSLDLEAALVAGARVILLRLPRGLDALDEIAELIARHADPEVTVFAGGMLKHMTVAMNEVLGRTFGSVRAGLARQKARVLVTTGADAGAASQWPRRSRDTELGVEIVAHAAAFAGARVDHGTRLLAAALAEGRPPAVGLAVDLGCGTGVLAVLLARGSSEREVVATDRSAAGVASAAETAAVNGLADRIRVVRDDAGESLAAGSARLVALNPPFHLDAAVHSGAGLKLIDAAGRLLEPGGELWCVWNSHLGYRPALERSVGPTRQVARDPRYTVTVSQRAL